MVNSIVGDIKRMYTSGNMVTRLVVVNVTVYLAINIFWVILRMGNGWQTPDLYYDVLHFFSLSSDYKHLLTHPWSLLTSMFMHEGAWHLLFNMLYLYWFGRIVGDLLGNHRVLPLYILGGLAGAVMYFLSANLLQYYDGHHFALGASAAVMAIIVAAGVLSPDYIIHLIILGPVRLKYIVAVLVIIDIIGMGSMNNTGGHFAHLGGALFGAVFIQQLRRGNDMSVGVNRILNSIGSFFGGMKKVEKTQFRQTTSTKRASKATGSRRKKNTSGYEGMSEQEAVDIILSKIKKKGFDSLSKEEKSILYNASKK